MRNNELKNTYGTPYVYMSYTFYGAGNNNSTAAWDRWPPAYGLAAIGSAVGGNNIIKLVGLKSGHQSYYNDLSKNKFYWIGLANDYTEMINMAKLGYNDYTDVAGAEKNISLRIYDVVKLNNISNGYYTMDQIRNFWSTMWRPLPQGYWQRITFNPGWLTTNWNPTYAGGFFTWANTFSDDMVTNQYELT